MNASIVVSDESFAPVADVDKWNGKACWRASVLSTALQYSESKTLGRLLRKEWKDEFIEGVDYDILQRGDIAQFAKENSREAIHQSAMIVLYESGVNLACIKTEKPVGRALRRFLATHVLPKLRVGESIHPPAKAAAPEAPPAAPTLKYSRYLYPDEMRIIMDVLQIGVEYGQITKEACYAELCALVREWTRIDLASLTPSREKPPAIPDPPEGYFSLAQVKEAVRTKFPDMPPGHVVSAMNRMGILGNTNYVARLPKEAHEVFYDQNAIDRLLAFFRDNAKTIDPTKETAIALKDVTSYMTAKDAGVQLKTKLNALREKRCVDKGKKLPVGSLSDKGCGDMFADLVRELGLHPLSSKGYEPTANDLRVASRYTTINYLTDATVDHGVQVVKKRPHAMFNQHCVDLVEKSIDAALNATAAKLGW